MPPDGRAKPGLDARPIERIGWNLFGSWRRVQLGIWIAGLPGTRQPRTFTMAEYWAWLRERELPGDGLSVRADLKRFVHLQMLLDRPDMTTKRMAQHWTRLDSPLWNLFLLAGVLVGEQVDFEAARRRATVNDLSRMRDELLRAQLVDACICPEVCDCQRPPTHLSNLCPFHNDVPMADEECPAPEHRNGARGSS